MLTAAWLAVQQLKTPIFTSEFVVEGGENLACNSG